MAELFKMDDKDLKRLRKFYKRAPGMFMRAAAGTLNAFAFGTRKEAIKIIDTRMKVRNPKFIHGSIKVNMAKSTLAINKMKSITGGVTRPRYTGLAEQELGTVGSRTRVFTSAARDGDDNSQTKGYARLKPQAKYPSPNKTQGLKTRSGQDFGLQGLSGAKRIVAFLHILSERKAAQTFILRKTFGRFKRGLYRYTQGKIKKLQAFDKKEKPKRIRWLTEGRRTFMTKPNILKAWANAINHQLNKVK